MVTLATLCNDSTASATRLVVCNSRSPCMHACCSGPGSPGPSRRRPAARALPRPCHCHPPTLVLHCFATLRCAVLPCQVEPGRYHVYVGNACPWCHRVLLALAVTGLAGQAVGYSCATDDPERASRGGWVFEGRDPVFGCRDLRCVAPRTGGARAWRWPCLPAAHPCGWRKRQTTPPAHPPLLSPPRP